MAIRKPVNVKCPQCGKESTFSMWQNVDSLEDPMLKQQIVDGVLFDFKCPYCDYSVSLHYDLLFNMPDHGVMLQMIVNPEQAAKGPEAIEAQERLLPAEAQQYAKQYIHRIVPDPITLREKIIIFELDMDDRVIELMKILYAAQYVTQKGVEPEHIFFSINNKQEKQFELYGESELLAIAVFDEDLYKNLQHSPQRKLKPIRKDRCYFVDREWAINSTK